MKLATRDAPRFFARPDAAATGVLIYGSDAMRVALRRQELLRNLLGPDAEDEMRLTRLDPASLAADTAGACDAIKAQGFFPGPRAVFLDQANDRASDAVLLALEDWREGDAQIVVTAGALKPTSKIRKAFEAHPRAYAVGIYDDPPTRGEVEAILKAAGLGALERDAEGAISALSQSLDPGDFQQTVEKLALYTYGQTAPVTAKDVDAVAPTSVEAELDAICDMVAGGRTGEIASLSTRLRAQGATATSLCIAMTRHFRTLYAAAMDPKGPASGITRVRPPVMWKRRDTMVRQAQVWGAERLEKALSLLLETDLNLRSSQRAPDLAVMERVLIRLAIMGSRH
ncbi:MAG: DNA polymerase III subunit delta [Pseudomonadota bacterium]